MALEIGFKRVSISIGGSSTSVAAEPVDYHLFGDLKQRPAVANA